MINNGLFTSFAREERPLSAFLDALPDVERLLAKVRQAPTDRDLDAFRGKELAARIEAMRLSPPVLGALALGRIADAEGDRRDVGGGRSVSTNRWYARYQVEGDLRLLERWPDAAAQSLRTVDDELIERIGGYSALGTAKWEDTNEYWRLGQTVARQDSWQGC